MTSLRCSRGSYSRCMLWVVCVRCSGGCGEWALISVFLLNLFQVLQVESKKRDRDWCKNKCGWHVDGKVDNNTSNNK